LVSEIMRSDSINYPMFSASAEAAIALSRKRMAVKPTPCTEMVQAAWFIGYVI